MKKLLLLLFLPLLTFGQATFDEGIRIIGGQPTVTSSTAITTTETDGTQGQILGENISLSIIPPPTHYTPPTANVQGHLKGIDNALGNIVATTAGVTTRIFFTGDPTTITAGTFYLTNTANKGTVAGVTQNVTNNDNEKRYFAQDVIGAPFATLTNFPPGVYGGNLSASTTPNSAQQRYTVELYKCNNAGTPIASGVTGAPTGSLGVTVVTILDSGLLTLADNSITGIAVSGNLLSQFTVNVGERVRYHVSAEKVGTAATNITQSVYYGSNYNSYIDVPVTFNSSSVTNVSTVSGANVTNALDALNTGKANDSNVIHKTGFATETKVGELIVDSGTTSVSGFGLLKLPNPLVNSTVAGASYGTGFSAPKGLALLANGDALVCNSGATSILRVPAGGGAGVAYSSIATAPSDIATFPNGDALVCSSVGNTIFKIPAGGGTATTYGVGYNAPYGVDIFPNGESLVCNSGTNTVIKIAAGGGSFTTYATGFNAPRDIKILPSGEALVTDSGTNSVIKIASGGGSISTYTTGLNNPQGITVAYNGDVFVCNNVTTGGNGLFKIPAGGGTPTLYGTGITSPYGIEALPNGDLLASSSNSTGVGIFAQVAIKPMITNSSGNVVRTSFLEDRKYADINYTDQGLLTKVNKSDIYSGTYTPTFSNLVNVSTPTSVVATYTVNNKIVTGRLTFITNETSAVVSSIDFTVPTGQVVADPIGTWSGSGVKSNGTVLYPALCRNVTTTTNRAFWTPAVASIGNNIVINFQYQIN